MGPSASAVEDPQPGRSEGEGSISSMENVAIEMPAFEEQYGQFLTTFFTDDQKAQAKGAFVGTWEFPSTSLDPMELTLDNAPRNHELHKVSRMISDVIKSENTIYICDDLKHIMSTEMKSLLKNGNLLNFGE